MGMIYRFKCLNCGYEFKKRFDMDKKHKRKNVKCEKCNAETKVIPTTILKDYREMVLDDIGEL